MTQPPGYPGSPDYRRDPYRSRHSAPVGYPPEDSGHPPADGYAGGYGYPGHREPVPDWRNHPDPRPSEWGDGRESHFGHDPEPWRDQGIGRRRAPDPDTLLGEQPTTVLTAVPAADLDPPRDAPPTGQAAPRKPRASKAPFFGIAAVVVLLLAGFLLFNRSREDVPPDLAQPARVVDRWLAAVFNSKNPEETLRYTCKQEQDRAEVEKTIRSVRQAEKDARTARLTMKVTWARPVEVSNDDDHATVKTTLTVTVGKQTRNTPAAFELVFEAGWRVCDADMT